MDPFHRMQTNLTLKGVYERCGGPGYSHGNPPARRWSAFRFFFCLPLFHEAILGMRAPVADAGMARNSEQGENRCFQRTRHYHIFSTRVVLFPLFVSFLPIIRQISRNTLAFSSRKSSGRERDSAKKEERGKLSELNPLIRLIFCPVSFPSPITRPPCLRREDRYRSLFSRRSASLVAR